MSQRRELWIVTGKGGVGKSTVSGALALLLSRSGRRTLLLEVDPRESTHTLFGVPPSGGEPAQVSPVLWLQNVTARRAVDGVLLRRLPIRALAERVRESAVYEQFAEGCPGLKEVALLGYALAALSAGEDLPRCDTVVLDAPATGHGVALLEAPHLLSEAVASGPFGELARRVDAMLRDPFRSAVLVVAAPEEMPVTEALELRVQVRERIGRDVDGLVVNGLLPDPPDRSGDRRAPDGEGDREGPRLRELLADRREIERRQLARVVEVWDAPFCRLPMLPLEAGTELTERLADTLADEGWLS